MSSKDADGHQKTKEGPRHWVQKEIVFFSELTWFWTHVCSFCGILYILIGRYCSICGSVAFYIVFTKWRHRCTRYSIHTDWDHHRSGDNHLHLHITIIEERVRLEFTVCTNSSHFCTFISSKIIPRYPNHSIPMLRIQYVDYISGAGVSDPDKGKHMGPEDPLNRKKYPSFF